MHRDIVTAEQLRRLLTEAENRGLPPDVTEKLRWFVHYTENRCPVEETCAAFGISRATFHRWAKRFDAKDLSSLEEKSRRPKNTNAHAADPRMVPLVGELRREYPFAGKQEIARRVTEALGIPVAPSSVGRIIAEHGFYFGETPLHRRKRAAHAERTAPVEQTLPTPEPAADPPAPASRLDVRAMVLRTLLLGSLAANLLFAGFLLGTASWERQKAVLIDEMRTAAEYREALSVGSGSALDLTRPDFDPDDLDDLPSSRRP